MQRWVKPGEYVVFRLALPIQSIALRDALVDAIVRGGNGEVVFADEDNMNVNVYVRKI